MDINVTIDAFSNASYSLKRHCRKIEAVTDFLIKRLESVHEDFDDVNYDRTVESVTNVKRGINTLSNNIHRLDNNLKALESIVHEYTNGGYNR